MISPQLLARALRAAAAVLDGAGREESPAGAPPPKAAAGPRHTTHGAGEAFEARTGHKTCAVCGRAIARGAMVRWGEERGTMVHNECADGGGAGPDDAGDEEIPFG